MDMNLLLTLGILVLLLLVAGLLLTRRRRSEHLAEHYGPEYERTVERMGSRTKAEADLMAREKRVKSLEIVALPPQEAQRFRTEWQRLQARFVDSPGASVTEADMLVRDLMTRRGYPMGDFETRAADISVDHPHVVEHYRAAHDIALRHHRGEADTEGLRQALVHYRALFADLLETAEEPVRNNAVDERHERVDERRMTAEERREADPRRGGFMRPDRAMAREEAEARERERRRER